MGLATLADEEILRTSRKTLDVTPIIEPHLKNIMVQAAAPNADLLRDALKPVAAETPLQKTPASTTIDGLTKYIPTESITLYVAAVAASTSIYKTIPILSDFRLYILFLVLTPILFMLVYMGKRRGQKQSVLPDTAWQWPSGLSRSLLSPPRTAKCWPGLARCWFHPCSA